MPLTRIPVTAAPKTVAETLMGSPETPIADVLLAQAFAAGTPWAPLYQRQDIPPDTWARWSAWLLGRVEQTLAHQETWKTEWGVAEIPGNTQWLARTIGEMAAMAHPHRPGLRAALRRMLEHLGSGPATEAGSAEDSWWHAQLATHLAMGHLGVVSPEEMTTAMRPWVDPTAKVWASSTAAQSQWVLRWGVPALTEGLARGLLTSDQAAAFLIGGGGSALNIHFMQDRAMLELPAWRSAWWTYFQSPTHAFHGHFAIAFGQHGCNVAVAWSTWTPAELEAWWTWVVRIQISNGGVTARQLAAVHTILEKGPDGPWLAAHPAFHLALRPLLESADANLREVGLQILGMTDRTGAVSSAPAAADPATGGAIGPRGKGVRCR